MICFKAQLKYKNLFNKVNAFSDLVLACKNLKIKKIFTRKIEKILSHILPRLNKVKQTTNTISLKMQHYLKLLKK